MDNLVRTNELSGKRDENISRVMGGTLDDNIENNANDGHSLYHYKL